MMRLPRLSPKARAVSSVSSDVVSVRTYSISRITGTGFMKCMPSTLSGRCVAVAIWMIGMDDVLLARMACGGQIWSSSAKVRFLISGFSVAASMTRSHAAKSSRRVVPGQALQGGVALGRGSLPRVDGGADRCLDARAAAGQQVVVHFADDGRVARAGTHLGDARAHQPAADHANSSDGHRSVSVKPRHAMQPIRRLETVERLAGRSAVASDATPSGVGVAGGDGWRRAAEWLNWKALALALAGLVLTFAAPAHRLDLLLIGLAGWLAEWSGARASGRC